MLQGFRNNRVAIKRETSYSRKPAIGETPAKLEKPAIASMLVTAEMFASGWTPEEAGSSVQWEL
jgi:hypothetical protein